MKLISDTLLQDFRNKINFSPVKLTNELADEEMTLDYFHYYNSVSSVYSSRIEGGNIELDSYFKHQFQNVIFLPDVTLEKSFFLKKTGRKCFSIPLEKLLFKYFQLLFKFKKKLE